jgi:hypothetical protein
MPQENNDQFPVLLSRQLKMRDTAGGALHDIVIEIGHPYWKEENIQAACAGYGGFQVVRVWGF